MISDQKEAIDNNADNFEIEGIIISIILFLKKHLPSFLVNFNTINPERIEDGYNNQLSMFLNAKLTLEIFQFQHQYERDNKKKPDIGVPITSKILQGDYNSIFDIECKRLNSALVHKKQYVCGATGGIERFKRNEHGTNLISSAIIGYLEDNSVDYWIEKINSWIKNEMINDESFWCNEEYLKEVEQNYCISTHHRITNNSIKLHHLFYTVNTG